MFWKFLFNYFNLIYRKNIKKRKKKQEKNRTLNLNKVYLGRGGLLGSMKPAVAKPRPIPRCVWVVMRANWYSLSSASNAFFCICCTWSTASADWFCGSSDAFMPINFRNFSAVFTSWPSTIALPTIVVVV